MKPFPSRSFAILAVFAFAMLAFGASAQDARPTSGEPSVSQIYQAANKGDLDRADAMISQVLQAHPNSAKAHYVKAEISARRGKLDIARQELATAEKIAPGLPFAKAESVQALRNQLTNTSAAPAAPTVARKMGAPADNDTPVRPAAAQRSFPWGTLLLVGAVFAIGMMVLRRRRVAAPGNDDQAGMYGANQAPGYGPMSPPPGYAPGYNPGYPQPQQPSMGSSIARGVGTGLAVGAGVVAAEEIGRRMFGHEHGAAHAATPDRAVDGNTPSLDQIDEGMRRNLNSDMGGNDFGIADGGWDDAGGGGDVGGGDWDS